MKKLLVFLIGISLLLISCAESKTFDTGERTFTVEPYGWANEDARKSDSVVYEINAGNIVLDIILCETIFVPIWLTGWELYEPVALKSEYINPVKKDTVVTDLPNNMNEK
jgi:hypothetical protein